MKHYAIITIDVQKDCSMPGAVLEIPGTYERREIMQRVLNKARKEKIPIIHVVRVYKEDGSNVDCFRYKSFMEKGKYFLPDTDGVELLEELLPETAVRLDCEALLRGEFQNIGTSEWIMYKSRFGAFYQTNLDKFLRQLNVDTLVFMGCNFPNCPRTSIYEACERDFSLVVIKDGLSGLYERGELELENIGTILMSAADFCEMLEMAK